MPFASLGVAPNGSCVLMMADLSPCGSHWVQLGSKCLRVCYCLPTFLLTNPRSRCARQSFLWNSSYIAVSLILYKDNNEWYSTLTYVLVCVCVSHSVMSNLFVTPWMVGSSPGSSVHGILQARILELVTIPFSRWFSQPREQTQVPCTSGRFFTV